MSALDTDTVGLYFMACSMDKCLVKNLEQVSPDVIISEKWSRSQVQ